LIIIKGNILYLKSFQDSLKEHDAVISSLGHKRFIIKTSILSQGTHNLIKAIQPIGHIAGIGAAITGFISTIMAVPIGIYIGSFVHTTALPLFIDFFISGLVSLGIIFYLKRLKLK